MASITIGFVKLVMEEEKRRRTVDGRQKTEEKMKNLKIKKEAGCGDLRGNYSICSGMFVGIGQMTLSKGGNMRKPILRKEKGFTLLELMIVIAIIGLLIAIVIPDLMKVKQEGEVRSCVASLQGLQASLELYNTHYKYYPDSLQTLVAEGYLGENGIKDPWSKEYRFALVTGNGGAADEDQGAGNANNYLIGSEGPDGKQDTNDDIEPPVNTKRHTFKKTADNNPGEKTGEPPVEE